jgi:tetratricopeptide (TPR) repeat protein
VTEEWGLMSMESKAKALLFLVAAAAVAGIVVYAILSGREAEVEIPGTIRARLGAETRVREGYSADPPVETVSPPVGTAQVLSVGHIRSCVGRNESTLISGSLSPRQLINECFVSGRVSNNIFDLAERQELLLGQQLKLTFDAAYAIAEVGFDIYQRGEYTAARAFFEAMVLLNYADAYFRNMVGSSYMAQKDLIAAVDSFNWAIHYDPENGHALLNRGECLYLLGRKEEALQDFRSVLALTDDAWQEVKVRAQWIVEDYY